jgi:hypothetical protein
MAYKFDISRGEEILLKVAAVSTALLGIAAIYTFYRNNVWEPRIEIVNVDYERGLANLKINGSPFLLKGDSTYLISADWGIKFGFTPTKDGKRINDRIEILKRGMVQRVLAHA